VNVENVSVELSGKETPHLGYLSDLAKREALRRSDAYRSRESKDD
jgi:hypothetical protein